MLGLTEMKKMASLRSTAMAASSTGQSKKTDQDGERLALETSILTANIQSFTLTMTLALSQRLRMAIFAMCPQYDP